MSDLTKNPWIVDTASGTAITTDDIRMKSIRWVGATTAGHTATIKDRAGRVKWTSVAAGANHVEAELIENDMFWDGIIVDDLDSGILYLEIM